MPNPTPLTEALPVRGDVAGVPYRQGHRVGRISEGFRDLEGRGLLALYTVGVHRVDQGDVAELLGDPLRELQGRVEVALDLDYPRPVREDLHSLAQRYLAGRHDDKTFHASTRRVGRGRGRCVPRRGADAGAASRCGCPAHGHRHAAVLERGRRVHPLELQEQAGPDAVRDPRGLDQGRLPLTYSGYSILRYLGQPLSIPPNNTQSRHPRLNIQNKPSLSSEVGPVPRYGPASSRERSQKPQTTA